MAQREICNSQEVSAINYSNSQPINDYMSAFPYHLYPPFWNFPVYNFPPFQPQKISSFGCKYCRAVTYRSVMTQTSVNQDEEQVVVSIDEAQSLRQALPQVNKDQIFQVKSEQRYDETVNFKEISNQMEPKMEPQEIKKQGEILQIATLQSRKNLSKDSIFQKMLTQYLVNPAQYQDLITEYMKNNTLMCQLVKYFHEKLSTFKKSKQQMIKLIIRKTQRHYKMQNNCKKDQRFKKFGGFKSMNSIYLQKLFSDPAFTKSYMDVMITFIDEFKNDNIQKLTVFLQRVYAAENYAEFKIAMKSLDQKNKMPWPLYWIEKLRKVTLELQNNFVRKTKQEPEANSTNKRR